MIYDGFNVKQDDGTLIETVPAILFARNTELIAQVPTITTTVDFLNDQTNSVIKSVTSANGIAMLDLTQLQNGTYTIRVGNPTISKLNQIIVAINNISTLTQAQQAKINELQLASDQACSTFQSSALGSVHTYLADEKSMAYLTADYVFATGTHYDNSTFNWYTKENEFLDHTGNQLIQVFLDGRSYITQQKGKLKDLIAEVNAATSIDNVNQIKWS